MAEVEENKKFLDLEGLKYYDGKIKDLITVVKFGLEYKNQHLSDHVDDIQAAVDKSKEDIDKSKEDIQLITNILKGTAEKLDENDNAITGLTDKVTKVEEDIDKVTGNVETLITEKLDSVVTEKVETTVTEKLDSVVTEKVETTVINTVKEEISKGELLSDLIFATDETTEGEVTTTQIVSYNGADEQVIKASFDDSDPNKIVLKLNNHPWAEFNTEKFTKDAFINNAEIIEKDGVKYLQLSFKAEDDIEPVLIELTELFDGKAESISLTLDETIDNGFVNIDEHATVQQAIVSLAEAGEKLKVDIPVYESISNEEIAALFGGADDDTE